MNKTIAILIVALTTTLSYSQELEEINPSKKKEKDNILKCRDRRFFMAPDCNGTVYFDQDQNAVMHSKSGKPYTGSCKVCHINGNLEMYLTYQDGKPLGQDTIWYENGEPQLIRSHDVEGMGKEHGTWKLYRADGSLKWEKTYVYGAEDGESRYYFPDSSLQKIETWKNGELHGKKQEFYPNNTLKKEIMYQNGEWDGKYITYFSNGLVESEQEFVKGKKEGLSRYYYENGNLFYEENHENGCREGEFRRFYPKDNRQWTVENYKDNVRHGLFEEYYDTEKNTIKYRATYKDGMLVEEHYFDEFGDETSPPEKKDKSFMTEQEKQEAENWPLEPTEEFLEQRKMNRKQYDKARKKHFKNKQKQQKSGNGPEGMKC